MPPRRDDGAGRPPDAEAHACRRACPWKTNVVMCASDRLEGEGNSSNVSSSLPAPAARRTPPGRHLLVTRQPRRRLRDRFPTCGGSPGSMTEERVSSKYASLLRKFEASRVFSKQQGNGWAQTSGKNGLGTAWPPSPRARRRPPTGPIVGCIPSRPPTASTTTLRDHPSAVMLARGCPRRLGNLSRTGRPGRASLRNRRRHRGRAYSAPGLRPFRAPLNPNGVGSNGPTTSTQDVDGILSSRPTAQ